MSPLPPPRWLADEPEIQSLLHKVLDRFDLQAGDTRQQRIYFPAERHLPTLKRLNEQADQLWCLVGELERLTLLTIRPGKRGPYDADWKGAKLGFAPTAEETLRHWLQRPRQEPALRGWRACVRKHADRFPHGIEPLLKRRIAMPGLDDEQIVLALARLGGIGTPHTLRQLSAKLFAGNSKWLDEREELLLTLFPELPLKQRALIVSVHLPEPCRGVLFIENQDTYAEALNGALPHCEGLALIYAAGFRGGAERIRDSEAALLHYHNNDAEQEHFESWWFDPATPPPGPVYFFGDLDYTGMAILAALRRRFGEVHAWQPGYEPLLELLRNGHGHTAEMSNKQLQSDPGTTGCPYADETLLPTMRLFGFIDQEGITV